MTLLVLIAIALFGAAVLLALRGLSSAHLRSAERLAQIDAYGYASPVGTGEAPVERRSAIPAVGAVLAERTGAERLDATRRQLLVAGMYGTSAETFLGYRVLSVAGGALLGLWCGSLVGQGPGMTVLMGGLGLVSGWMLPPSLLARRGRLRLDRVDREMPELVDLLVVGVESGMGFGGAMRAAAARIDGPLGDELKLMLREQSLGASTSDSLRHLLDRCDTPATRSFVRTITQGERLGVSIGSMMRSLAEEMRKRRKARAEELAHKAPVKMLFPLVFLIFPAIFIVLLGPAMITFSNSFGG